jgi:RNA polymerase sigma-70 factor (ECF subfamily)
MAAPLATPPPPELAGSTSRSLLARLKDNSSDAWERLVALYGPLVYHWCWKLDLPRQEMADVFQDVFQAVAVHIGTFRKDRPTDTFRGWLRTITRSKVLDHFRRQQRQLQAAGGTAALVRLSQLPADAETDDRQDAEPLERQARRRLFGRALAAIRGEFAERTWLAFWRVVVDGRSPEEAGGEPSMRPATVRVCKSRVLHRLRQELGDAPE